MTDPLAQIVTVRRRQDEAHRQMRSALSAAVAAGVRHQDVANAAGISRTTLWRRVGEQDGPKETGSRR